MTELTDTPATQWIDVNSALPLPNQDVVLYRMSCTAPQTGWLSRILHQWYVYGLKPDFTPSISNGEPVDDVIAWAPIPTDYPMFFN